MLTCSCARGVAVPDSCVDILEEPDLYCEWQAILAIPAFSVAAFAERTARLTAILDAI